MNVLDLLSWLARRAPGSSISFEIMKPPRERFILARIEVRGSRGITVTAEARLLRENLNEATLKSMLGKLDSTELLAERV